MTDDMHGYGALAKGLFLAACTVGAAAGALILTALLLEALT